MDVYVSFKDVLDYFEYVDNHKDRIRKEYLTLATVLVDLEPGEIDELALDERIDYIEIEDGEEQEPQNTYTFGEEVTSGHWDVPDVMSRYYSGYRGRGVKIGIIDNGFENTYASDGTLDVEYKEIKYFGSRRDSDHGVTMGSIMGAKANGTGIIGSASEAELHGLNTIASTGTGMSRDAIIDALNWCIENKMDVVSMSLGGRRYSQTYHDAIKNCHKNNIIVVVAAGNDAGSQRINYKPYVAEKIYPASFPECITVSACMYLPHSGVFLNQYNYTDDTDISTPVPRYGYRLRNGAQVNPLEDNGYYGNGMATSGATAFTAGIVATIRQQYPGISRDGVLNLLLEDSFPVKDGLGRVPRLGMLNKGAFGVKTDDGWRKSHESSFDTMGMQSPNAGANVSGALYTTVSRMRIDSTVTFQENWENAFRRWPTDAIPSFDSSKISNSSRMFDQIKTGGTIDLSEHGFPNVNNCIYMFAGSTLDSLDISGIVNMRIFDERTLFTNSTIKTLFVANQTIADRIWNGYYNSFPRYKIDYICIGKSGAESTRIYKANRAGHFKLTDLSNVDNMNVTIVEHKDKHWFHSPNGRISIDLPKGFTDFNSPLSYLNVLQASFDTGNRDIKVRITVHHDTKGSMWWDLTSRNARLTANVTETWEPSRVSFYAPDEKDLWVSIDLANHFKL